MSFTDLRTRLYALRIKALSDPKMVQGLFGQIRQAGNGAI